MTKACILVIWVLYTSFSSLHVLINQCLCSFAYGALQIRLLLLLLSTDYCVYYKTTTTLEDHMVFDLLLA